jgi:hypothetical protein
MEHFVPLAMDTYFRGNSAELEFCKQVRAGGNHVVAATASGKTLGTDGQLRLRERELSNVLTAFDKLPADERQPKLTVSADIKRPQRPTPEPPRGGLTVRGYCTYMKPSEGGKPVRSKVYYYKQNPDRWAVETQSDMLWLTEAERNSLLPKNPTPGKVVQVSSAIQQRFFSTIGIDYMEGSVNSLPTRDSTMTITVEQVDDDGIRLRLNGYGRMGKPFDEKLKGEARTRGCEVRVLGKLHCDRAANFDRFDIVGVGKAWGNKMNYTRREMSIEGYPWMYGIACELVTGDSPIDHIPPYNLLHYNGSGTSYFSKKVRSSFHVGQHLPGTRHQPSRDLNRPPKPANANR